MEIIVFLIVLLATLLGSVTGMGGGIIIKPVLDAANLYPIATVNLLSSITVLSMCVVSLAKGMRGGFKINTGMVCLSIGAAFGGLLGKNLFDLLTSKTADSGAKGFQAVLTLILLTIIFLRRYYPSLHVKNKLLLVTAGAALGIVAAFLGIGGGPFNVVVICMLFSISGKEAVLYALFTIFFSQTVSLSFTAMKGGFSGFDFAPLLYMVPAGVGGGFLGSALHKKLSEKTSDKAFWFAVLLVTGITLFNIMKYVVL